MVRVLAKPTTRVLVCALAALGVALIGASVAVANGGGSAGNSQYVDPLSGNGPHGHHHSRSHGSPSASSQGGSQGTSTSPSSGSSSTLTSSPPSSVSSGSTTSHSAASSTTAPDPGSVSRTLPFTGLNVWACALVGVALLAGGGLLRRTLARGG